MPLARLARLITVTTEVGHAAYEATGMAASRTRDARGVDVLRVPSTSAHPTASCSASNAYLFLLFSVDATVRQGAYALVVGHKKVTRLREAVGA